MKKHFVMCQGLPASGKSTWAEQQVLAAEPGKAVRVNQDLLRTMLNADRFKGQKTEKHVRGARDLLISMAMGTGTPLVISDDTNFHPSCEETYRALCAAHGYEFYVQDFTHVTVKECIARDLKRARSVGHKVIQKMALQWLAPSYSPPLRDETLLNALIVDIDGTLAHMTGRSPYDYTQVHTDVVDPAVRDIVQRYASTHRILVVSGRKDDCRNETYGWLARNDIPFNALWMRKADDNRDDSIVKGEIYEEKIAGHYNVDFVLDDRDRVVSMWRARGLKVLQVAEGDF